MVCSYDMGKMGKTRTNMCTQKTGNRTKGSHSKIEKSTHNSVRTLQEKYKNILGSMQPVIVLEKCLIPKNILHQNSFRVSLKNSVNNAYNANDTSRLVYSTNHISYQSLCIEKAKKQESVRNRKVDRSKSSKKRTEKAAVKKIDCSLGKVSLNTKASENFSKTLSTCSNRNTLLERKNSIPKSDSTSSLENIMEVVDTKNEVNAKLEVLQNTKCLKVCLERIVLYDNKSNMIINEHNNLGHLRKNNLKETMTLPTECKTNTATNSLVKRHNNYSTKHKTENTVVSTLESAKADDTSSLLSTNSYTSTIIFEAGKNLNAINLEERLIVPSSNELRKHTKKCIVKQSQKRTIIEDTDDASTDSDTVQSSQRILPSSNKLRNHAKTHTAAHTQKSTKVGDTENVLSASTKNLINSPTDTGQSFKRIIMPISRKLSKHIKNHSVEHPQKNTIIEDTEDTDNDSDTVQSSQRILPSNNELRKYIKKHTLTYTRKNTIIEDTEDTDNDSDTVQSSQRILPSNDELRKYTKNYSVGRARKSIRIRDSEESDTDTVQSSKKIIMPSSNELSEHTKNHSVGCTQECIIKKDSEESDTDTVQSSKKIIMPSSNELSEHTKNHTVGCTQESIIIKDPEDTDTHTVQSSKKIIMSSSNELTKHAKEHAVTHTQESTIIEDKEDTDTVQSSKRGIMPSSNQLSKQTKRHTVTHTEKSTIVGDTKDTENASCPTTRNFINPPGNTVRSSERIIVPRSNDSKKETKENTVANNQKSIKLKEEISKKNNVQHESLERRKRVHSMDSNSNQDLKKVKLNRCSWRRPLETANETIDRSKEVGKTETNVKLTDNRKVLQSIRTDVPGSSVAFPKDGNITYGEQVAKANLTEERGVSSREKQISTETFGYSDRVENVAWIDARKPLNAVTEIRVLQNSPTEIRKSVVEKTSFVSEDENFNNSCSLDDEDDCISLFADSMLVDEYDTTLSPQPQRSTVVAEKPYVMTDNVMDRFYKRNALEFNEAYNVNYSNNIKSRIIPRKEKPVEKLPRSNDKIKIVSPMEPQVQPVPLMEVSVQPVPLMKAPVQPVKKSIISRLTLNPEKQPNNRDFSTTFRGFCYVKLRKGTCTKNSCHYRHQLTPFLMLLYEQNETSFMEAINDLVQKKCLRILQIFYDECINYNRNFTCILKLLKTLYDLGILGLQYIHNSIKLLITRGSNVNEIVDILATVVKDSDTLFVTNVSNSIISITQGDVWSTLKPLLIRINKLGEEIVKILLNECILTRKHIPDVYENVVCKLDNKTLSRSTQDLLSMFRDILRKTSGNVEVQKPVASTSSTISSPSFSNEPYESYTMQTGNLSPKVWYNCIDDNNNAQRQNSTRLLHPTDNVPSPYSGRSRELFWKFYLNVHSLQEGLKYKDYKHVKKILDEAQEGDASLFTRACYKILWSNVEHSPAHLRELASLAVRDGATATYCKILIDLTIHILADLAARELWILAFELLKSFEVILHEQSLIKFDAVVLMLFCEIYLANRKPMKAYNLLKKSNIIYTYRGKWKVRNNVKDENIRAQILTILLQMLCDTFPQYAYSLFEFLIADQSSNFKPIDLSYQANKLVSSLLLRKDHDELIVSIGQLINNYNCTLYPITYRKLISSLVHIDLPLAKQLYQVALLLGIYSKMQLEPMIYIIVKSDWTSEEMYLAIVAMMQELLENLGHAIDGVKPFNLPVHLVFECTPSDKQLFRNKQMSKRYDNKIEESIALMKGVLETKFDPPLSMVKSRKGKFQKLNSVNLCKYLQCNQNFMQAI